MTNNKLTKDDILLIEDEVKEAMFHNGFERRFCSADKKDINKPIWQFYVDISKTTKKGLYIYGKTGRGKTHFTAAIAKEYFRDRLQWERHLEFHERLKRCQYPIVNTVNLFHELRKSFGSKDQKSSEIVEMYSKAPLLIIDDLGSEISKDWTLDVIQSIIVIRYNKQLRTTVTSNLTLSELEAKTTDRIASRIMEMCVPIEIQGKDRRS